MFVNPSVFEMTWYRYAGAMKTEKDVENSVTRTITSVLGRYSGSTQTTFGTAFPFGNTTTPGEQWNQADALTGLRAPSGKHYTWTVTAANRPQFAFGGGFGYAQVTGFTPAG